jgi:hypothetical protein
MMNFDSPSREACTVRETRTNTPLQALNLMNDVTFLEAARKLAERIVKEGGPTPIDFAYRTVVNRTPTPKERQLIAATHKRFRDQYDAKPALANQILDQGESPLPRKLSRPELAAWTQVASLLLNLDETITRQ